MLSENMPSSGSGSAIVRERSSESRGGGDVSRLGRSSEISEDEQGSGDTAAEVKDEQTSREGEVEVEGLGSIGCRPRLPKLHGLPARIDRFRRDGRARRRCCSEETCAASRKRP